jgi:hypothetical protein
VAGHRAEVRRAALLERHLERRRLARADELGLLARDLEVVLDLAAVGEPDVTDPALALLGESVNLNSLPVTATLVAPGELGATSAMAPAAASRAKMRRFTG